MMIKQTNRLFNGLFKVQGPKKIIIRVQIDWANKVYLLKQSHIKLDIISRIDNTLNISTSSQDGSNLRDCSGRKQKTRKPVKKPTIQLFSTFEKSDDLTL